MPPAGRLVRRLAAVGGAGIGLFALWSALAGAAGPAPSWLLRLYALWCVGVPYWWYCEYRWLIAPAAPGARAGLLEEQRLSRDVWLGFVVAIGVLILARARSG